MTVRSDARWLVTGAHGLLGRELVAALAGRQVTARGRSELDITDPDAIADAISGAAYYTFDPAAHQGAHKRKGTAGAVWHGQNHKGNKTRKIYVSYTPV
mgnify:CR=1 FL=1